MKRFIVQRREIWVQNVEVELPDNMASVENAIDVVSAGSGTEVDDTLEYSDTTNPDYWTVDGPTIELSREEPIADIGVIL
jgi:hypothetical protein